jgi:hypothetical protein
MSLNLPIHNGNPSRRNKDSRDYFTSSGYTPPASTEALNGPVREPAAQPAPIDRLIVGVDFGTTFSGSVPVICPYG